MPSELKEKVVKAALWSFLEAVGLRGVQFVVGIILARLLLPAQFGLIGMLMVFMAVAQSFLDSGFGAALIQKQDVTEEDTSSIFYFNLLVGIIAAGGLCLIAPGVAAFYEQPILTPLLRVMSLVLVINAFSLVQSVLLTKEIDFKTQTKVSLIASLMSGVIGIVMAYRGYGVWSLAVQQISSAAFRTALLWVLSPWRPAWLFSLRSLRGMFRFGSKLLCSGLLNTVFDNIYLIVIGKLFSPADLGFFTRADSLQKLPSTTLSGVVARVTFPIFATIQDDPERMKRGMKKALSMMVLVNFPMMIGLAVVAKPLVLVLLTEKWAPCIPYLQLLCVVGLMYPLHLINLNALQALGRSDLFLRLEIAKKMLIAVSIAMTWQWGITAMIAGQIITSLASCFMNAHYNKALVNYSFLDQVCGIWPYLACSVLMGGIILLVGCIHFSSSILLLVSQVTIGGAIYLLLCHMFKIAAYRELLGIILTKVRIQTVN